MEQSINAAAAAELRELADQLRQAERIRDLTAQGVANTLARQLPTTTGMAVHPESIRQAATTIVREEATRDEAEAALQALGDRPEPALTAEPTTGPAHAASRRRSRLVPFGVLLIFALAAAVTAVVGAPVAVPIGLGAAGLVIAFVVWAVLRRRRRIEPASSPTTPTKADAESEWMAQRSKLEVDRDRALERLRSARRQWVALAGPDADPHNIDAVLQLHDPQFRLTGLADDTSPTVRTANALYRRLHAKWKIKWAALGYDDPPEPEDFEKELAGLAE